MRLYTDGCVVNSGTGLMEPCTLVWCGRLLLLSYIVHDMLTGGSFYSSELLFCCAFSGQNSILSCCLSVCRDQLNILELKQFVGYLIVLPGRYSQATICILTVYTSNTLLCLGKRNCAFSSQAKLGRLQRAETNPNPLWVCCHPIPYQVGVSLGSPLALECLPFPRL